MSIEIIKKLFITLCFTIIFFIFGFSLYMVKNNYSSVDGIVEQTNCTYNSDSKIYICDLTINYLIDGNKIVNRLVINSEKKYEIGDTIGIDYDKNNYLNISFKTEYKKFSIIFCLVGLIFLISYIYIYKEIRQDIFTKIDTIMNYISFL